MTYFLYGLLVERQNYISCFGVMLTHLPLDKMAATFADDIFKCIFLNKKFCILIQISVKFIARGPIGSKSALVQVMAWRRTGYKPLSEPIMA